MQVEITKTEIAKVRFCDLKHGDVFIHSTSMYENIVKEKDYFMKIKPEGGVNYVRLLDGDTGYVAQNAMCEPVTHAKLVV